jgi:hypothetical protein
MKQNNNRHETKQQLTAARSRHSRRLALDFFLGLSFSRLMPSQLSERNLLEGSPAAAKSLRR